MNPKSKICYFGIYRNHPRNTIFISLLKLQGYSVTEIVDNGTGLAKYVRLGWRLFRRRGEFDCVIVGFPGQQCAILARCVFGGPVIFNALLSLHDAVIGDRRIYSRKSFRAAYFWLLDYFSARASDVVIFDCDAYIDYFTKTFKVRRDKCARIFLGADESAIKPAGTMTAVGAIADAAVEVPLEIHYYSSFIPTHGTNTIILAAKLLEPDGIRFVLSGNGQTFARDKKLAEELSLKNLTFIERFKSLDELNAFINSSWVCLGLFADVPRVQRSISSKVFEALRCGKPIITGRAAAGLELLTDREDILFVNLNDPADLAGKIRMLKADEALRQTLARGAAHVYAEQASWSVLGGQLAALVDSFI